MVALLLWASSRSFVENKNVALFFPRGLAELSELFLDSHGEQK